MKKLIVIEGLDKVGKTTLVLNLKDRFQEGAAFFNFPSSEFSYLRNLTKDFENTTPYLRDLAHALSHGLTYLEIEKIKDSVDYVICDRYYFSSFVYSNKHRMEKIEYDWMDPEPLIPDIFIYLYSEKGYSDFADSRDDVDPNDSMSVEKRNEFHENYLKLVNSNEEQFGKERVLICVDGLTPADVYYTVLNKILS